MEESIERQPNLEKREEGGSERDVLRRCLQRQNNLLNKFYYAITRVNRREKINK